GFDAASAGARPKSRLVANETASVNPSAIPSILISLRRGKRTVKLLLLPANSVVSQSTPHTARSIPTAAPQTESNRLSVSDCLTMRHRLAPNATPTAVYTA